MNIWEELEQTVRAVTQLQEDLKDIREKLRDEGAEHVRCPMCGGGMKTVDRKYYSCNQDNALCGMAYGTKDEAAVPEITVGFQRTCFNRISNRLYMPSPPATNLGIAWFIAGKVVGAKGYSIRFDEWADRQSEHPDDF